MSRARRTSGSMSTAPTARSAFSTPRSRLVTAAWNGPTRWFSTPTSGLGFPSMPAARLCGAATTCATRSASSRHTYARTPTQRSVRSPNTGSSRRDRSARSRRGRPSPRADVPASRRRWRARTHLAASSRRWSSVSPSWSWRPRLRPPSSPSGRDRQPARPPGWTSSTEHCRRRFRRRGRTFVTGTVFGGRETLRACILHPDTSSEHLATLVAEVVATARSLSDRRH